MPNGDKPDPLYPEAEPGHHPDIAGAIAEEQATEAERHSEAYAGLLWHEVAIALAEVLYPGTEASAKLATLYDAAAQRFPDKSEAK